MLAACVALVAHPDDERYQPLFGTTVRTPLYGVEVPVLAHELAQPDKGTGIAMICTFGDTSDVTWWRELNLPMRAIIGRDGRILLDAPADVDSEAYAAIAGLTVKQAQAKVIEQLTAAGSLLGEPRPLQHPVKFYERGERPLEIVTSRQWYIRNGGRDADLRAALVARAGEVTWHPAHMRHRYENWVEGLNGDWLVSRQRFFGVPVPVWYPLDAVGEPLYDEPLLPEESRLPIDPSTDVPVGYTVEQRDQPGGFTGDPDIFDTWATSSMTPQIAGCWEEESDLFERVFPMDMRPQAHDIIRTWLFATMVRSHHEFGVAPWSNAALSGWILDPDRKKMSKSKGNVVTPLDLFETYGTDAVRYWAGSGRPGVDTAFSEDQMKVGRKLATKLLNVTKFVLGFGDVAGDGDLDLDLASDLAGTVTNPLDRSMLAKLDADDRRGDRRLRGVRLRPGARAHRGLLLVVLRRLRRTRQGPRLQLAGRRAGRVGPRRAAHGAERDPTTAGTDPPFATEESWSWWNEGSIHRASWPVPTALGGEPGLIDPVVEVLTLVRRAKTEAKQSQRSTVESLIISAPASIHSAIEQGRADLADAGSITTLDLEVGESLSCETVLATTT